MGSVSLNGYSRYYDTVYDVNNMPAPANEAIGPGAAQEAAQLLNAQAAKAADRAFDALLNNAPKGVMDFTFEKILGAGLDMAERAISNPNVKYPLIGLGVACAAGALYYTGKKVCDYFIGAKNAVGKPELGDCEITSYDANGKKISHEIKNSDAKVEINNNEKKIVII